MPLLQEVAGEGDVQSGELPAGDAAVTVHVGRFEEMQAAYQAIESWMRGTGAAAINNLMEDVATAEISRSQIWQWVRHSARLSEGPTVTDDLVREIADEEMGKLKGGRFKEARKVFEEVALSKEFHPFLTLVAMKEID